MDSKNIFIACSAMLQKADWEKATDDSEWYYIGDVEKLNSELVQSKVNHFFSGNSLYLVTDRHRSKEISKTEAYEEIQQAIMEFPELTVSDLELKRFITFSNIGVARNGVFGT